jgi:hypothetical protein
MNKTQGSLNESSQQDPIHAAAQALGALPKNLINGRRRKKRQWTGFIGRVRMWVGRPVLLPDGTTGWIKRVEHGVGIVKTDVWDPEGYFVHEYWPVSHLRVAKNPHAVLLGARKRGIIERRSQKKAEAARRNGTKAKGRVHQSRRTCRATGQIVF